MPPSILARVRPPRPPGIAALCVAAVAVPLFAAVPTASAVERLVTALPATALVSPDTDDAAAGGGAITTPTATPAFSETIHAAPSPTALAEVVERALSAVRRAVTATSPPVPLLRDMLVSAVGGLRTPVGLYTDCSGRTPLTDAEAAIDTCIPGPTYFVGHDVGVFTPLMSMAVGDLITWYDATGAVHVLRIVSIRDGWQLATSGAPRPTEADVVAQLQTCEPYSPSGADDRIVDTVAD